MATTRYGSAGSLAAIVDIQNLEARAARGDASAQYRLATCYEDAVGVPREPDRALGLYRAAARSDLREAQVALGIMLALGDGVHRDYGEAWAWFSRAAGQGDDNACELARLLSRKLAVGDREQARAKIGLAS